MSLARNRSGPESRPSSQPQQRAVMEFVGHRGSSAGGAGLLVVPSPNYLDLDFDDEDEEIVIGIRPKSSPQPRRKTSFDEEDSDISEPPSLSGSRRVSFADAVGLSLVQIKEFDKWDVPQLPDFLDIKSKDQEEYFISLFNFTLSLSPKEIAAKVTDQKVELESIELLPDTTILKGVIRVLNISFTKAVYVRTSLDNWVSHFDLLSEYISGSSDGQMDSFSFKLTLVPPFTKQGARVDFCLRYETPCGTFWANNSNRNYVLFCHKRKKEVLDKQKENVKKSCLKAVSPSFSVEESMSSPEREYDAADVTTRQKDSNNTQSKRSANSPAGKSEGDDSTSQVENRRNRSRRNRRKAARAARVLDYFAQKDMTTQDSEPQTLPITQTEAAQEQNKEENHGDCVGNIQLEGSADSSLPNDSNCKQHEKLNLADAAISTDDGPDESNDLPNTVSTPHQNINKFVSSSSEERSPEAASDCTCLSGERVDSEKLVSDSGSFAFGTVVAPLYHQVSCRVGGQAHSEACTSASAKDRRETDETNSSGEMNDCKDVGLCCNDEKVGRIERGCAVMDIVGMPKDTKEHENGATLKGDIDSQLVVTNVNSGPIPMDSLNYILSNSSKIVDLEREIHDEDLNLENHVTVAQEACHAKLQFSSHKAKHRDEIILKRGAQENPSDLDKRPCQRSSFSDLVDPVLDNTVEIVVSSLSDALIQEENVAVSCQASQNEYNITEELGLDFVGKTSTLALEDFSEKAQEEENVSYLLHPSQQGLVDEFKNQSIEGDKSSAFVSLNHVFKECNHDKSPFTSEDLQRDSPSDIKEEINLNFDDKTVKVSPSLASEKPGDANQFLLLEHACVKNVEDESANTSNLINDSGSSTVLPSLVSTTENPHLTSRLAHVGLANQSNQVYEDQIQAASSASSEEKKMLKQNEKLEKSSQEHNNASPISRIQESKQYVENSFLLAQNYSVQVSPTSDCGKEHGAVAGTVVLPTIASPFYDENSSLSFELSHNDKLTSPGEVNVEHNERMVALSQNLVSTRSESSHQLNHSRDPIGNLVVDHKVSKAAALPPCQKNHREENPYLRIQLSENNAACLEDQSTKSTDLVAHPYEMQEFAKTAAILPEKGGKNTIVHFDLNMQEIMANSDNFSEAIKEKAILTSCTEIVEEEIRPISVVTSNKSIARIGEIAVSKEENYNCCKEADTFATDDIKEVVHSGHLTECKISSKTNNLEDDTINRKIRADKEKEDITDSILQTEIAEIVKIVEKVQSNFVEDAMLKVSDSKVDLICAGQLKITRPLSFRTDAEEDTLNELDTAQETAAKHKKCFVKLFENEKPGLCTNYEENKGEHASKSSMSVVANEKDFNECIASQREGYLDSLPATESMSADYKKEEKVEIHWKADEEERSDKSPCIVECNLSAPMSNVQVGSESSLEKIGEKTTGVTAEIDKTDFLHCSKDTNDWSEGASQVKQLTFTEDLKYEQTSDNDSNSDTESDSEDEMELYMHCLRAVCGQQSSPKVTRAEQSREKEFKRLSVTRGKRLSTSLPSISESLDEEQQYFIQENDLEKVEVQLADPVLPDSSPKEENSNYLWWKKTFSCRNILKTMLYATLVLVFVTVAYHYDFIACFGLYVISVIWLFFQGERQKGKNN